MIVRLTNDLKVQPFYPHTFVSYFGGAGWDQIDGLAINRYNDIFFSGWTTTGSYGTFPIVSFGECYIQDIIPASSLPPNNFDGFIARINNDALVWSTAIGGNIPLDGNEGISALAIHGDNLATYGYS